MGSGAGESALVKTGEFLVADAGRLRDVSVKWCAKLSTSCELCNSRKEDKCGGNCGLLESLEHCSY
jgi:hypothetical protein